MPKLIADGRVPMSTSELMQIRLDMENTEDKDYWRNNYFCTGDAVIYHPDGMGSWDKLKIDLDSQYLREMTPQTPRNNRTLVLTDDQYNAFDAEEFTRKQVGKINKWLSNEEVKIHAICRKLARYPKVLENYADYVFAKTKEKFGDLAMGIYTPPIGNSPEIGMWYIDGFTLGFNVNGWYILNNNSGRFVGVLPKEKSTKISDHSNVKTDTTPNLQPVFKEREGLEDIINL